MAASLSGFVPPFYCVTLEARLCCPFHQRLEPLARTHVALSYNVMFKDIIWCSYTPPLLYGHEGGLGGTSKPVKLRKNNILFRFVLENFSGAVL